MTTFLPKEVQIGLDSARIAALRKSSRLRVETGEDSFRVLRLWSGGFTVEADVVPPLRGLVDLFDGSRHLCQCLIVAADAEGGEMKYEFKRSTEAHDRVPLDFCRAPDAPVAYLAKD